MSHIYQVTSCQSTSPTTMTFTLHNTNPDRPLAYQPGQYATISFMRHGRPTPARCFSITSSPTEQDILQFSIRIKGHYTRSAARSIRPGSKLTIDGPYGGFIFNVERDKTAVFLAGGIGIAPFMGMIRYAARLGLQNEIMLLYGCRDQTDVAFAEELMYLEQVNPHFHVVFAISDGPLTRFAGHHAVSGRVTPEMLHDIIGGAYALHSFFICGPPPFMQTMRGTLKANHARKDRVLFEVFNSVSKNRGVLAAWPGRVYALTAVGLVAGTASTLAHDIMSPKANIIVAGFANSKTKTGSNSRDTALNDNLSQVKTSNGDTLLVDQNGQVVATDNGDGSTTPVSGNNTATGSAGSVAGSTGTATGSGNAATGGSSSSGSGSTSGSTGSGSAAQVKPTISFGSSATSVVAGGSVTLSWSVAGSGSITCTASGGNGWSGSKATSGSASVAPAATTTYTLTCTNSAGSSSKSVTVSVTAAPVAPSVTLGASSVSITAGGSTTLTWSTTGTAPVTCNASGGWSGSKAASGSQSVSPAATTTYSLSCSNSAGSNAKSVTINVTAAPVAPSLSLTANSTTITQGGSVTLSWSASGTAPISCTASGNGWSGSKASSGSETLSPSSSGTYTLSCSNSGGSTTKSVSITVNPASSGS